jgi:hypothetical protein
MQVTRRCEESVEHQGEIVGWMDAASDDRHWPAYDMEAEHLAGLLVSAAWPANFRKAQRITADTLRLYGERNTVKLARISLYVCRLRCAVADAWFGCGFWGRNAARRKAGATT